MGLSLVLVALLVAAGASSAFAAPKSVIAEFGSSGNGDGQLAMPRGVAVNQSTGDVYVASGGEGSITNVFNLPRVERFGADGDFLSRFGAFGLGNGQFSAAVPGGGPQAVAVDQSSGAVYVTDLANRRVQKFSSTGVFERAWGWGVADGGAAFQVCVSPAPCQAGIAGSGAGQLGAGSASLRLAVDPSTGDVYVADPQNRRIQVFGSNGAFLRAFGWGVQDGTSAFQVCSGPCQAGLTAGTEIGRFASSQPLHLAIDSAGVLYASDSNLSNRVQRFDISTPATPTPLPAIGGNGPLLNATTSGLAVDPSSGHLLVARDPSVGDTVVQELDSTTLTVTDTHAIGEGFLNVDGIAVNGVSGRVYASRSNVSRVAILADGATPPSVTLDATTDIDDRGATFNATIDPNGARVAYRFEYRQVGASAFTAAPLIDRHTGAGTSAVGVSEAVSDLMPNTAYEVRHVADGAGAPMTTATHTFSTDQIAPQVATGSAITPTGTGAILRGHVDPNGSPTTYHFEWGETAAYGNRAPATEGASAGQGATAKAVAQRLAGLSPSTTYHYRVVADGFGAPVAGQDRTFTTPASRERTGLPDGRAYELVTPPDKGGGMVFGGLDFGQPAAAQASADGGGIAYQGSTAFPGTSAPSSSLIVGYASTRAGSGWATESTAMPLVPTPGLSYSAHELVSDDGSKAVVRTNGDPVTGQPTARVEANFYWRDLETGTNRLINQDPVAGTAAYNTALAAATPDLGKVLFESDGILVAGAPPGTKLYRFDGASGLITLESRLPDGSPSTGVAGEDGYANALSADGSVAFFKPVTGNGLAPLYRREDGTTVAVNSEENPNLDVPLGVASFRGATSDGSKVFFVSVQPLVAEDANAVGDLYRYDADAPTGSRLTLVSDDAEPLDGDGLGVAVGSQIATGGVLGFSDDGELVYFVGTGQIVAGASTSSVPPRKLYLWDSSSGTPETRYLAALANESTRDAWSGSFEYVKVSPDGRRMAFLSSTPGLTPQDGGGFRQVYRFDAHPNPGQPELVCLSCPPGAAADAETVFQQQPTQPGLTLTSRRNLSADGERVFFETTQALVDGDGNGRSDVYLWEDGELSRLSRGDGHSSFADASASGDDVFIFTGNRLVGWDRDDAVDIYDVKAGGGFPEPGSRPSCAGDACQGQPGGGPDARAPGSASFSGSGNDGPRARQRLLLVEVTARQRAMLAAKGRATLRVRVTRPGRVSLVARARLGRQLLVVARSTRLARRGGTVRMPLALSPRARARLAGGHRLVLRVSVRASEARSRSLRLGLRRSK